MNFQALENDVFSCNICEGLNCKKSKTLSSCGFGNIRSKVIFYGSSVGGSGDSRVIPFSSGSGKILDKIFSLAGIEKEEIYISNVVKCRLPNLRSPKNYEIKNCRKYVLEEINIIKPNLIVPLGSIASRVFLGDFDKLDNIVYKKFNFNGIDLFPMYHPAFIMRGLGDKQKYFDTMIELMNKK